MLSFGSGSLFGFLFWPNFCRLTASEVSYFKFGSIERNECMIIACTAILSSRQQ